MVTRNSRRLEVRVASELDRGFSRPFQQAQRQAQSFGKQMETANRTGIRSFNSGMDVASQRLRGFVGLATGALAGGVLLQWAGDVRDSANQLTESVNAVNVVFEEAAGQVLAFGENAAESVGLAESEFNQLVTPIGAMLRNFGFDAGAAAQGAITLTQRAADLASVFNTDVSEALAAIQAALRGEQDPLERFGASISAARVESFLLSEGLVATKSAIDDADKVMGRYQLILEDTARVSGDFAATSDENANKTRIFQARLEDLQAEVGQALIPLFDGLVDAGGDLIPVLETLGTEVLPIVVDVFGNFLAGLAEIVETVAALPGPLLAAAAAAGALGAALKLIRGHPIIAGLGLIVAGISAIGDAARTEQEQVDELREALDELAETGDRAPLELEVRTDILDVLAQSDQLKKGLEDLDISLDVATRFVLGDPAAISRVRTELERTADEADRLGSIGGLEPIFLVEELRRLSERYGEAAAQAQLATESQEEYQELLDRFGSAAGSADRALLNTAEAFSPLNRARAEAVEASEKAAEAAAEEKAQTDELTAGIRELAQTYAQELNTAALDYLDIFSAVEEVEPVQGVEQLLTNVQGRVEVISGFLSGLQRLRDEGLFNLAFEFQTQGVSAQNVAELEAVITDIDQGGATAFQLEETLEAAKEETGRITAAMGLELARSKAPLLSEAQRLGVEIGEAIASGVERVRLNFSLRVGAADTGDTTRGPGSGAGIGVTPLAGGGRFRPGDTILVGETQPEVLRFDGMGGTVFPSVSQFMGDMLRPTSGAVVTNNWNIALEGTGEPDVDAQRVGAVASVLRRVEGS